MQQKISVSIHLKRAGIPEAGLINLGNHMPIYAHHLRGVWFRQDQLARSLRSKRGDDVTGWMIEYTMSQGRPWYGGGPSPERNSEDRH